MSFPTHSELRESSVEWLGQVPCEWTVAPVKHLAEFVNGEAFKPGEWSSEGIPIIRIQNLNGGDSFNFFTGEVDQRYHVEFGDLLFSLAQFARHAGIDPEAALRAANAKFERRFRRMEAWLAEQGRSPCDATPDELETLWAKAKQELG